MSGLAAPSLAAFPDIALHWASEAYALGSDVIMGRQSAGAGFIRAVAAANPSVLTCYAATRAEAETFKSTMEGLGAAQTALHWIPLLQPAGLGHSGLLFRPDAAIWNDAWHRAAHGGDRSYSICGITHTIATHVTMASLSSLLTAPLHGWDALICTSKAARAGVRSILEATQSHLKERVGATRFALPQMPIIPLGVDCAHFSFDADERDKARGALGIAADEAAVTFVGRLSFHAKAHPVPMYLALEQAARGRRVVLIQAGWFANRSMESVFREEAARLCPSVRCLFVDGRIAHALRQAWAATDIFTSLVDNIQETFGLTPIEAMAAGLPSVVSDWDGYRETVRDGIDGYRIPTLTLPPGTGGDLADRYDLGIDGYDTYLHHTSQLVAVDIDAAARAYARLLGDPGLRRRMGEAARRRAREHFDWSVILSSYLALWADLRERRAAAPIPGEGGHARRRPDRADPFTMFSSYPTALACSATEFRRARAVTLDDAVARSKLRSTGSAKAVLPAPELIGRVLAAIPEEEWIDLAAIERACARDPRSAIARAAVWLAKFGILQSRSRPS